MTTQHPALRLADMTDITDRSVIWQKWKQDACEQLRTQHALLERASNDLSMLRGWYGLAINKNDKDRLDATLAAITTHLEPK